MQRACPDWGQGARDGTEWGDEDMLRLGRKGKGWSWACGPSPRNDRAGGGAARAQGHSVLVTMATATSQLGTGKGWEEGVPRSLNLGTERGTIRDLEERQRETVIQLCENLPISESSEPGTLWVLNECPSETESLRESNTQR